MKSVTERLRSGEATYGEATDYLCAFMAQADAEAFRRTAINKPGSVGMIMHAGWLFSTVRSDELNRTDVPLHERLCALFIGDRLLNDGLPEPDEWRLMDV